MTRKFQNDPDGTLLPIKLDTATNGEFLPTPLALHVQKTIPTALNWADENAKRLNQGRREFLVSVSGAATCLLAMNHAAASVGQTGGLFDLPEEAALDYQLANAELGKKEFVFDIQTHHFNSVDSWTEPQVWSEVIKETAETTGCNILPDEEFGHMSCIDARVFVREMFQSVQLLLKIHSLRRLQHHEQTGQSSD